MLFLIILILIYSYFFSDGLFPYSMVSLGQQATDKQTSRSAGM